MSGLRVMFSRTPTIPHYVEIGTADVAIVDEQGLSGLGVTPLMTEQFHLIGLPTPGAETRTTIKLQDVATLPLVLPALKGSIRAFIDQTFAKQGLRPIVEFEVDSASALLELVQDGWGYTILPYSMVHRSVMKDEVEARLITHSPIERMLWTALPANRPSSAAVARGGGGDCGPGEKAWHDGQMDPRNRHGITLPLWQLLLSSGIAPAGQRG